MNFVDTIIAEKRRRMTDNQSTDFTVRMSESYWTLFQDYLKSQFFDIPMDEITDIRFMGCDLRIDKRCKTFKIL